MSDLVRRLRTGLVMSMFIGKNDLYQQSEAERGEAAARIEQLEADNARLREAVMRAAEYHAEDAEEHESNGDGIAAEYHRDREKFHRAALESKS